MPNIKNIIAREILDSRGYPTVEVDVELVSGAIGRASVPSGASVGTLEALELRDSDDTSRFNGKGVLKVVNSINTTINKKLQGMLSTNQQDIDCALISLDGTSNKSRLGANAVLGVSLAVAKAASNYFSLPLFKYIGGMFANIMPIPLINVINGGQHADNPIDFQEFMISPVGGCSFSHGLQMSAEVFYSLKAILKKKKYNTNVGDEGGFAPNISNTEEVINILIESIESAGYSMKEFNLALDVAASTFYKDGKYAFEGNVFNSEEFINYLVNLVDKYPITSMEDVLDESDHEGWQKITEKLGQKVQLVGDDLFVTNCDLISIGIEKKMANAILIKPNQIGTLSETLEAINLAHNNGYKTIISHRSGETEDTTIAHIAVASGSGQIKTGSLSRSDRLAKYNELLRIEEILGNNAVYGN